MASQILQDIPNVIPLFPLDGSSYTESQRIQIEIPSSIQCFKPNEAYLSVDVLFPTIGTDVVIAAGNSAGEDPAAWSNDTLTTYTTAPQTWGNGGAHGMFRDVAVYSMGTGEEIDRINYYNVACRGILPFLHGKDEASLISQEQGLCLWRPDVLNPASTSRLYNQLAEAVHPFDLQYFHQTAASPNMNNVTASTPRKQRYTLPFRFGFMSSDEEFLNLGGLRLDILLDTAKRSIEFYNIVTPSAFAAITAFIPATPYTQVETGLNQQFLLGLANHYPVGVPVRIVDSAGIARIRQVAGYTVANNNVAIQLSAPVNGQTPSPVGPPRVFNGQISFPSPTGITMSWTIDNVALYVRQMAVGEEAMKAKYADMEQAQGGGYSFRSLYNYPLNIIANQTNPVLNYNIVPLKFAQGLLFIPTNDSDVDNAAALFPGRLSTTLLTASSFYPGTAPKQTQYQVKIGNQYVPLQPTSFDKVVPQVIAKEMDSFVEVCLGNGMMTNEPYSLDNINSQAVQNSANILQFFNRPIACVLSPNSMSAMDISTQNIQLLLFSASGVVDNSQYTIHLYASHMRHLSNTPSGLVCDY